MSDSLKDFVVFLEKTIGKISCMRLVNNRMPMY